MKQIIKTMLDVDNTITIIGSFGMVPHIWVSASRRIEGLPEGRDKVDIPFDYVRNGKILLKLSAEAIGNFNIDFENGYIRFGAAFAGKRRNIVVPIENLIKVTNNDSENPIFLSLKFKAWSELNIIKNPLHVETQEPSLVEEKPKRPNHLMVVK